MIAAELVVTVKKSERFVRRLFQAAVEIIKKRSPKASFVDFHRCGSFHKLPLPQLSFFFASFSFFVERAVSSRRLDGPPAWDRPMLDGNVRGGTNRNAF